MLYLDYHSTTPVLPEVWDAMRPYLTEAFGNPASPHQFGRKARHALESSREQIASLLDADADEVIFTGGATEANNLAIFGLAGEPPAHLLASKIEHPCVIEPLEQLARRGFNVEWFPVAVGGTVSTDEIAPRIGPQTRLLTLMRTNHETGAVQPVAELARRFPNIACHTDASQAVGKMPVHFHQWGVASLSASGHKFGAPKGIGLLLLRRDQPWRPSLFGGHQQHGRRPGTEPVALAVSLAKALELSLSRLNESECHVKRLRARFIERLREAASPCIFNSPNDGSPYVVNVSFPGCPSDLLLVKLDLAGVACSAGAACSSGSLLPSPVLRAMGVSDEVLRSALRFSFGPQLRETDVVVAAERIVKTVNELRN